MDAPVINLLSASFTVDEKVFDQSFALDFGRLNDNDYLTTLSSQDTPNFLIIDSPELVLNVDRETVLSSSLVLITVLDLHMQPDSQIKALVSLKALEISEKDYICGVMGASHVGFGYFGSGISYTNCLDDFFEKYFNLINRSDNHSITVGQAPYFFRLNQYYDQNIFSDTGGVVQIKARQKVHIEGSITASGTKGMFNNDIVLGSSSGGTVYIESARILISGRLVNPRLHPAERRRKRGLARLWRFGQAHRESPGARRRELSRQFEGGREGHFDQPGGGREAAADGLYQCHQ